MSLVPYGHASGIYVKSSLNSVAKCLDLWGKEDAVYRHYASAEMQFSLDRLFDLISNRAFTPNTAVLVEMNNGYTAFFDNQSDEFLSTAEPFVLCERLKVPVFSFSGYSNAESPHFGNYIFCGLKYTEGVQRRHVSLIRDGSWKFTQTGQPYNFENILAYKQRKMKDRMSVELLKKYGDAVGLKYYEPSSYTNRAMALCWDSAGRHDVSLIIKNLSIAIGKPVGCWRGGTE